MVMPEVERSSLPVFNRLFGKEHFWDGRAKSLEEQPRFPIENRFEMHTSPHECTARVAKIEGYRLQFEAVFGQVSFENICRALASFERVLVTGPSAWDFDRELAKWEAMKPDEFSPADREVLNEVRAGAKAHPLSPAARRGGELFFCERVGCGVCHSGPNLTDEECHDLGLPVLREPADLGRFAVTKREADRRAFKTPSLRNVGITPPYMHDGRFHSLEQVVAWFSNGERSTKESIPLDLSAADQVDLVEFLKSLNSPLPPVETGRLPP